MTVVFVVGSTEGVLRCWVTARAYCYLFCGFIYGNTRMSLLLGKAPAKRLQVRLLSNSSVTVSLLKKLNEKLTQDLSSQNC